MSNHFDSYQEPSRSPENFKENTETEEVIEKANTPYWLYIMVSVFISSLGFLPLLMIFFGNMCFEDPCGNTMSSTDENVLTALSVIAFSSGFIIFLISCVIAPLNKSHNRTQDNKSEETEESDVSFNQWFYL